MKSIYRAAMLAMLALSSSAWAETDAEYISGKAIEIEVYHDSLSQCKAIMQVIGADAISSSPCLKAIGMIDSMTRLSQMWDRRSLGFVPNVELMVMYREIADDLYYISLVVSPNTK